MRINSDQLTTSDEISDKVSLIVESSMDVDDDPAPRKRKRKGDKENTIGRLPNGENGDKSVRKRKGKGTQKGNGGCTAKDANDNARNGGGGKASKGSNEASKRSGEAAQESDTSVDKEIQAEQEEEENREYLFQVKVRCLNEVVLRCMAECTTVSPPIYQNEARR